VARRHGRVVVRRGHVGIEGLSEFDDCIFAAILDAAERLSAVVARLTGRSN